MMDIQTQLDSLRASGNYRRLRDSGSDDCRIESEGFSGYNLSSNDYLGLSGCEELREEFLSRLTARNFAPSASSSRLLTGNHHSYGELEDLLCNLYGRSAALVCGSGYHVNIGVLPTIADRRSLILADKLVHASIIDGIRLSEARTVRFRHNDYQQLERLVAQNASAYDRVIVVTESVFSMDGDVADLKRLTTMRSGYDNVWLYVDEAHAVGVRGETGLGVAQEMGVVDQIDILVGTFGKALCSVGAYVICDVVVKRWLVNNMRSLIFSTALPPVNVMWSTFVLQRLAQMNGRREYLAQISQLLGRAINGASTSTHIVPQLIGESEAAVRQADRLQKAGYFVLPIRPPTVPKGGARLRFSLTANLPLNAIEELIAIIAATQMPGFSTPR